jgi:hypothetical protein
MRLPKAPQVALINGVTVAEWGYEASRVFRRLLFVRRSCDERYKEQVFA